MISINTATVWHQNCTTVWWANKKQHAEHSLILDGGHTQMDKRRCDQRSGLLALSSVSLCDKCTAPSWALQNPSTLFIATYWTLACFATSSLSTNLRERKLT